jgi:hypothetical protein
VYARTNEKQQRAVAEKMADRLFAVSWFVKKSWNLIMAQQNKKP